ncbi:MAG: NdvB protein [Woeseiaceae bacterium]
MRRPLRTSEQGARVELTSPTAMPDAGSFLWNARLLLHVNCRGFVTARHMQPEAAKYSYGPVLEQQTFMQPEQPRYAHHPGRFVYVRDEESGELFSLPHEPVRRAPDAFAFSVGRGDIEWRVSNLGIDCRLGVAVPVDDVVELWLLHLDNPGDRARCLSVCTNFSIGYMSWMNQSAAYDATLAGIVARSIAPYQALTDYEKVRTFKDCTFLVHDTDPVAWECALQTFEGEGGIGDPDALRRPTLGNGDACYELPAGILQYRLTLQPGESRQLRFLFGPARDDDEIGTLRDRYFRSGAFSASRASYERYLERGAGCLSIETPDAALDDFVNHWLNRQVLYHGDAHRVTADPQTRNFLQDSMGMAYIDPAATRKALLQALGQQAADGSMPDGIVLAAGGELTYINRIPHTDHCVWVPVCLEAYLDETADFALLDEPVGVADDGSPATVSERVTAAMRWLIGNRDDRCLSLIGQGDWCDPMNMVGHGGKGVSGWLSIATVHALRLWSRVCRDTGRHAIADEMDAAAEETAAAIERHLWDGRWYARGISDDGTPFGIDGDREGRIYLNPQSWAMLAGLAREDRLETLVAAIEEQLGTPYGTTVLAPAYTSMNERIGRLTQKFPGVAENGSIYNHAATFYIFALLRLGDADRACEQIRRMIPGPSADDLLHRGQLPIFVPNYYRGDVARRPRTAGRSSQLFNTGAASWLYRCLVEGVFGLRGSSAGLHVAPNLPSDWETARATRRFRGATFDVRYRRDERVSKVRVSTDGQALDEPLIRAVEAGAHTRVEVRLPAT